MSEEYYYNEYPPYWGGGGGDDDDDNGNWHYPPTEGDDGGTLKYITLPNIPIIKRCATSQSVLTRNNIILTGTHRCKKVFPILCYREWDIPEDFYEDNNPYIWNHGHCVLLKTSDDRPIFRHWYWYDHVQNNTFYQTWHDWYNNLREQNLTPWQPAYWGTYIYRGYRGYGWYGYGRYGYSWGWGYGWGWGWYWNYVDGSGKSFWEVYGESEKERSKLIAIGDTLVKVGKYDILCKWQRGHYNVDKVDELSFKIYDVKVGVKKYTKSWKKVATVEITEDWQVFVNGKKGRLLKN